MSLLLKTKKQMNCFRNKNPISGQTIIVRIREATQTNAIKSFG